jgi:hypothetical protein
MAALDAAIHAFLPRTSKEELLFLKKKKQKDFSSSVRLSKPAAQ